MTVDPAVLIAAISALASGLGVMARVIYRDLRRDRDEAIAGWRAQTDATNRLADLLEDASGTKPGRR